MSSTIENPTVTWEGGGDATVLLCAAGTLVTFRSSRPFPPGAPPRGTLRTATDAKTFQIKIAGSRKVDEGVWEVRGRLLSATVDVLAAFAVFAPGA